MALPAFTMRQLLEAGVHFGHSTRRWNPKMAPYLFGARNNIHIIDLQQTVPMLHQSMVAVKDVVAAGGRVLFVGTKRQASSRIADAAKRCGQYYVNHRWLGGMMTNWQTISNSIKRLRDLDDKLSGETVGLTKKELLGLTREQNKLERALGGIKEMGGLPDILVVIDTNKEAIAVAEANKLGIPVVGVIDSNSQPDGITYPVPGNDDAIRAINLYCDLMVGSVLDGIQQEVTSTGGDAGASSEGPVESLPKETAQEKAEKPAAKKEDKKADKPAAQKADKKDAKKADEKETDKESAPKVDKKADKKAEEKPASKADKEPAKADKADKADTAEKTDA
ncbi:MAG: 30S ribosomal protein S2 [Rhodospirillales bacterium]|nr:30S ribosomal protein S2 [Alphaproteobacteria bacterium]MBL6947850.1 30S ribosomal protein S2 [Rhodospirillales bacterium]